METKRHGIMYFTTIVDKKRGDLSFIELPQDIGFDVKRVFFVHGEHAENQIRGGHRHKVCKQVLIAMSGVITVDVEGTVYTLMSADRGVFVDAGVFSEYKLCDDDSVLLVLASEHYDPEDYINDYQVP